MPPPDVLVLPDSRAQLRQSRSGVSIPIGEQPSCPARDETYASVLPAPEAPAELLRAVRRRTIAGGPHHHVKLADTEEVESLNVIHDHSRFLVASGCTARVQGRRRRRELPRNGFPGRSDGTRERGASPEPRGTRPISTDGIFGGRTIASLKELPRPRIAPESMKNRG